MAFQVDSNYSNCSLTAFCGIPTLFETFLSHSMENRNGKPLRILPECGQKNISNAVRISRIHYEFPGIEKNFHSDDILAHSFSCEGDIKSIWNSHSEWPRMCYEFCKYFIPTGSAWFLLIRFPCEGPIKSTSHEKARNEPECRQNENPFLFLLIRSVF